MDAGSERNGMLVGFGFFDRCELERSYMMAISIRKLLGSINFTKELFILLRLLAVLKM